LVIDIRCEIKRVTYTYMLFSIAAWAKERSASTHT